MSLGFSQLSSNCLTALLVNKILLGPLPKIFPESVLTAPLTQGCHSQ